jgi:tRNA 2-thiouridine synthesizing protein A
MDDLTGAPHDHADAVLDITAETCPMTYVRTRLALDRLAPGQVLEVRLRGSEPARNVPCTAVEQGHLLLWQGELPDEVTVLRLRRGGV